MTSAAPPPWSVTAEAIAPGVRCFAVRRDGRQIGFVEALQVLRTDATLRQRLSDWIAAAPWRAVRFETPPLCAATGARPFEFVLIDAPELERPADPSDFAAHFRTDRAAVDFPNLGGDAHLVVPCPPAGSASAPWAHLAAFVRDAAPAVRDALWIAVADATLERISEHPRWLSTAGDGVPWLHVRLDSRPKYYRHAPYRPA